MPSIPRPRNNAPDDPYVREINVDVLPPQLQQEAVMRAVAKVMDDLVRIPGTRFRLGLDPLIGLLPGLGDAASGVVSTLAVFYASRGGLPRVVLMRMAANVAINGLFGAVPFFGDALSFWFKSNRRNYKLLAENIGKREASRGDKLFIVALLVVLIAVLALIAVGIVMVWTAAAGWVIRKLGLAG